MAGGEVRTNGAQLVAHREAAVRSPPATRSSSREAGSSAACTEPSSASERCSTGSSSPSMHYLRGKMTAAGKLLISRSRGNAALREAARSHARAPSG